MTWEKCDLREWLNREFLKNGFTPSEQENIALSKLVNDSNVRFCTVGGNITEDRVFCLSFAEAELLFKDDTARKCVPMPYAAGKGVFQSNNKYLMDYRGCWWLLRSSGKCRSPASYVRTCGTLSLRGHNVDGVDGAVCGLLYGLICKMKSSNMKYTNRILLHPFLLADAQVGRGKLKVKNVNT